MSWWQALAGTLTSLAGGYAILLAALWMCARRQSDITGIRDTLRLLPDLLRLVRGLIADKTVPRGTRIKLAFLLGYLLSPLDLVPDFLPVIGYADDAIIVAVVLRSAVRSAGIEPLRRHWTGTPAGQHVIERLVGLSPSAKASLQS